MPLSHGGRQVGDVGGDQMFCLLVCFVYLMFSSERVKRVIVLTLSVQSLGRGLFSSMQRGFRLRLRESHGLEIHVTLCAWLFESFGTSSLVDRSTNSGDSHEVCGG